MGLKFLGVRQRYGDHEVVRGVDLQIPSGELHVLLGASGSGKTTLLRVAAGLERVFGGEVRIGARVVDAAGTFVPPEARGVGFVFQDYALFPHMRVAENVAFGLGGSKAERRAQALELLEDVGLSEKADAWPHTLSGGQQQRVALARALAVEPALMLLDEPFSGLDAALRGEVRRHTRALLARRGVTALMVTHDPEEAIALGQRISVLREGRLEQSGTPDELYHHPATAEVARFLGPTLRFDSEADGTRAPTPLGPVPTSLRGPVVVLVRREASSLHPASATGPPETGSAPFAEAPAAGSPTAVVVASRRAGALHVLELRLGPDELPIEAETSGPPPEPGTSVGLRLDPSLAFVYPRGA